MKKLALVIVPLAVIAGAACATPWYVGMQADRALRNEASSLSHNPQFPFAVSLLRFDRGWLSSTAVTRFTLKADADYTFDVRHDIAQLPDPREGWVRVHSVPVWSGPLKALLEYYFGNQPALSVDTVVGFDSSRTARILSPAFSKAVNGIPSTKLNWGGLQGTVNLSRDERMAFNLVAPQFGLEAGEVQSGLKKLSVDANWNMQGTAADWQGETKLAVGEFRFAGPQQQVALRDLSGAVYQRTKGDSVLIGYVLRLGAGSSHRPGEAEDSFSNAVLDLEFDQIDKRALAKYLDAIASAESMRITGDAQSGMPAQPVLELAMQLLRGSPVIRLRQLGVETPAGGLSAQATVAFDGTGLGKVQLTPELLSRLKAKGNLEISGTLLRTQLQRKARAQAETALAQQGASNTEVNLKALAEKLTEEQLKSLTDSGLLHASGSSFTVEAEFAGGQVLVNGQPASQLFGGMLMPAPAMQPPSPSPAPSAPRQAAAPPLPATPAVFAGTPR